MNEKQILLNYTENDNQFLLSIITKGIEGIEDGAKCYTVADEKATAIIESLKQILG